MLMTRSAYTGVVTCKSSLVLFLNVGLYRFFEKKLWGYIDFKKQLLGCIDFKKKNAGLYKSGYLLV